MKIGIDASILARGKTTGINRFLRNLLKYILEIDKKNEYFLFAPCKLQEYKSRGFNVITIGENKIISPEYYFPIWLNFVLPVALKKTRLNLFFQPNYFLPLFIHNKEIKFIITIHDLIPQLTPQYREFIYRTYLNILLPTSIKKSQFIITVSESTKKDVIKFYDIPAERIFVIYEASDDKFKLRKTTVEKKNELISRYRLPEKFILHIGAVENRKNIFGILNIGDLLKSFRKDIKIVLIGKPGFGFAQIIKEIKKRDNVSYFGHIKEEDLPYIYNLAEIFLFPSFYEGFGLPPLEAMQSGIPVLASNISSLPEIIGDGGIMHSPNDYEGFVKDIINLLDDKDFYQTMKQKAMLQAKKFSWKESTKKLVKIFNEA
jgi:glycosyltransferase involved in cell wall biosynthesis